MRESRGVNRERMSDTPTCGERNDLSRGLDHSLLLPLPADGNSPAGSNNCQQTVHCWACHTMLTVPSVGESGQSGQPVPVFQVGLVRMQIHACSHSCILMMADHPS